MGRLGEACILKARLKLQEGDSEYVRNYGSRLPEENSGLES